MKSANEIRKLIKDNLKQLSNKYPIASLAIFGSVATNNAKPNSDVDILIEFSSPVGLEFVDLAEELESILDVKVDLVSKRALSKDRFSFIEKDLIYV